MGAAGAGLATFLSNCAACGYFFLLARVKKGNTFVCLDIRKLKNLSKEVVLGILGVGIPASIQNLLNVTGSTILNNFTAGYGAAAVAAMGVSHKVNMLPMQVCLGFSQGIMPLVSYNYASGNRKRMKDCILFALGIILPAMGLVTVGYWFGAPTLIQLFMKNPEHVFTREALLSNIWGIDYVGETRTVDVHIGTLRTKLKKCGKYIETVRGVGYRLGSIE
jgi:Na+-driven multidrug efflux pump